MEDRSLPRTVKKRDGSIVPFNAEKIRYAVERAAFEVRQDKKAAVAVAAQVTQAVLKTLAARYQGGVPSVEAIQDTIEKALMEAGYAEIARAYILYRQRRQGSPPGHVGSYPPKKLTRRLDDSAAIVF